MLDGGMVRMLNSIVENEIRLQPLSRELLIQIILELEKGNALHNFSQEQKELGKQLTILSLNSAGSCGKRGNVFGDSGSDREEPAMACMFAWR